MADVLPAKIPGVFTVRLKPLEDARGRFFETWRQEWIPGAHAMIQGNRSESRAGVLRGLHFHRKQADYWYPFSGRIRAGLFDVRRDSPTFRRSEIIDIAADACTGLYIPPGVAHGFLAQTDCVLTYLVDQYYDGADEHGLRWDDPELGIDWGISAPVVSNRDRSNPSLADLLATL